MQLISYLKTHKDTIAKGLGIGVAIFVLINIAIAAYFRDRTYPNATVANKSVGSMSHQDLEAHLNKELLPQKITLVYGNASTVYTPKELGIQVNTKDITQKVMRTHWLPIANFWATHEAPVYLKSSGVEIEKALKNFGASKPQQKESGEGLQINTPLAARAIVNALREGKTKVVLPTTVTAKPPAPAPQSIAQSSTPVKKTYTYCTAVKNVDPAYLPELETKLASVYGDNRGWNLEGAVSYTKATSNCNFTVWLSAANDMPSFGAICDTTWSCTVSPNVILNFDRWQGASAAWTGGGGSLDDYRTMVINHETGHWLGFYHKFCGGAGQPAPVMQQQSIDLQGCAANPWPLDSERVELRKHLKL